MLCFVMIHWSQSCGPKVHEGYPTPGLLVRRQWLQLRKLVKGV